MDNHETPTPHIEIPFGQIEQSLIDEFIRARGYDPLTLVELPPVERDALLQEASIHASAKLTEIESRSHLLDEIRGDVSPGFATAPCPVMTVRGK